MSKSLVYLALYAALVACVIPMTTLASAPTMSSTSWSYGDEITVSGGDLEGVYVRLKHLCFSSVMLPDKNTCFGQYDTDNKVWDSESDPLIKRWDTSTIVFTVPLNVPPQGVLKLFLTNEEQKCFGSAGCDMYPKQEEVTIGQFMAVPHITDVMDSTTGTSVKAIQKGSTYKIKGTLFGIDKGSVQYGDIITTRIGDTYTTWHTVSALDIQSWDTNEIRFTSSATFPLQGGIQINNGASPSNVFVPPGSSSSNSVPSSSASSSSSAVVEQATTSSFKDVQDGDPYLPAIEWGKSSGILQGYPDGTFQPERTVNRAEFLKIVLGAKGIDVHDGVGTSGFQDVGERGWYAPYVRFAKAQGIIQGYPDGTFKPDQAVNFAEALKMTYNALGVSTNDIGGEWYQRFLQHAKLNNVVFTADARVDTGMSRKDVVWIVWKVMIHRGEWQQPPKAAVAPQLPPVSAATFADGDHIVGTDIRPGTYRTRKALSGCYYARLSGFSGELEDILANDNTDAFAVVTIAPTDRGFTSERCGTWTQDLSAITTSRTSFGDGTFIVGTDIEAGTYKSTGDSSCYYARLRGFSGELHDIIANENTSAAAIVTITGSDKGFVSHHCGTWVKMQ